MAIGIFFAVFSPASYSSRATVIPEYELQDRVNEIIESYGLLFGLTGSIRENRTPSYLLRLYPYMINSIEFKRKLMREPFEYGKEDSITLYQYFTEIHRPSTLNTMYQYTFGLPSTIMNSMQASPPSAASLEDLEQNKTGSDFPILDLTSGERKVISELSGRISAGYDRQTGIVQVSATMPKAGLAPKVVQMVLQTLHEHASAYKTSKGRSYMRFLQEQQIQQKKELEKTRNRLIEFNGAASQPLNKRMELQSSYETNLDQYNSLSSQLNRIKLTIREQMPAFRILDDITTPGNQIEPNRKLILLLSVVLGFFIAFTWITILFFIGKAKDRLNA